MKRLLPLILFLTACTTAPRTPMQPQASAAAATAAAPAAAEPLLTHIVIVATTDMHGWYSGHAATRTMPAYGGVPLIGSYVNVLRSKYPVVLVDSGDLFQGTFESNFFEGEPVIKAYNAIGYNAVAVGNHEFDYGPVGPDSVPRHPDQDPLGALKHNVSMATFPFLSANMTEKLTGKTPSWAKRYTIVDAGGVKVGIIGLSTPSTPSTTTPANVAGLDFGDPLAATVSAAKELRAAGAEAVIVIAHMGGRCRIDTNPEDPAACESEQEAQRFLTALPKGTIDAYFGGHTHQQMHNIINGVPALQPLAYGREIGIVDMTVDRRAHKVAKTEMRPLTMVCGQVYAGTETCDPKRAPEGAQLVVRSLEGRNVGPATGVVRVIDPYLKKVAAKRFEPVNITTSAPLRRSYSRESVLGDLLTDAMRNVMKTDVAVLNSGGIRADLPAGALVYDNVFEVAPFDNYPAVVVMTGAQITEMLRRTAGGEGGILQISGLHYSWDDARSAGDRLTSVTLPDGKPIDPDATYRVATIDFLIVGGGLEKVMKQVPADRIQIDYSRPIREVLIEGLRAMPQPVAPPPLNRITVTNPKTSPSDHG